MFLHRMRNFPSIPLRLWWDRRYQNNSKMGMRVLPRAQVVVAMMKGTLPLVALIFCMGTDPGTGWL